MREPTEEGGAGAQHSRAGGALPGEADGPQTHGVVLYLTSHASLPTSLYGLLFKDPIYTRKPRLRTVKELSGFELGSIGFQVQLTLKQHGHIWRRSIYMQMFLINAV